MGEITWQTIKHLLEMVRQKYDEEAKNPPTDGIDRCYLTDPEPFVLVERTKPNYIRYIRAKPYTAYKPHPGQALSRIIFGLIAKQAKGKKMTGELPPAAELVKQHMKGMEIAQKPKIPKWVKIVELLKRQRISSFKDLRYSYETRHLSGISKSGKPNTLHK